MQEALSNAKIIILVEGKRFDPVEKQDDKEYDEVRRLNLHIDLIQYENNTIERVPCCDPNKECLPIGEQGRNKIK